MTDAELVVLKIGDRVALAHDAPEGISQWAGAVKAIDRRLVWVTKDNGGVTAYDRAEVDVVPLVADVPFNEQFDLRSLEARWRALTDEVLVVLTRLIARGARLDQVVVHFSAHDDGAGAEILRLSTENDLPVIVPLATCAIGLTISEVSTP